LWGKVWGGGNIFKREGIAYFLPKFGGKGLKEPKILGQNLFGFGLPLREFLGDNFYTTFRLGLKKFFLKGYFQKGTTF